MIMSRYTHNDVRAAFAALVKEATACGIDTSTWEVRMAGGSVRNFTLQGTGTRHLTDTTTHGAIGTTAREAVTLLRTAAGAFAMVSKLHNA